MKKIFFLILITIYIHTNAQIISGQSAIGINIDTVNIFVGLDDTLNLNCDNSITAILNVNTNSYMTSAGSSSIIKSYLILLDSNIQVAIGVIGNNSLQNIYGALRLNQGILINDNTNMNWSNINDTILYNCREHRPLVTIYWNSDFTNKYIPIRKKYGTEYLYGWMYGSAFSEHGGPPNFQSYGYSKIDVVTKFPKYLTIINDTLNCNSSYLFTNGYLMNNIFQDTVYDYVLPSSTIGCDSLIRTKLHVNFQNFTTNYDTICIGTNYQFLDGSSHSITTNPYIHYNIFNIQNGCDSIIRTKLMVKGAYDTIQVTKICGSNYMFPDSTIVLNIHADTLQTSYFYTVVDGCDSFKTTKIIFQPFSVDTLYSMACTSYFFNNQLLTNSGIYYDTLHNTNGCDSLVELHLIINSISNNNIIQHNDTLVSTFLNVNYQWITCNPFQLIQNATNQNYLVTANGDYAVIVSQNGCNDTSTCFSFLNLGFDGIGNIDKIIHIYPNPVNSVLYIKNAELLDKFLYNSVGQLILNTKANEIEVRHLPKGIYYLKCEGVCTKVIVE